MPEVDPYSEDACLWISEFFSSFFHSWVVNLYEPMTFATALACAKGDVGYPRRIRNIKTGDIFPLILCGGD